MTNESVTTSPNMLVICSHRLKNWSTRLLPSNPSY